VDGKPAQKIADGQTADVLLDTTPFYAEAGGQIGDTGVLRGVTGAFSVTNTTKKSGLYFHAGHVATGTLTVGDTVVAEVESERRRDIMRNHTATHLLHKALRARLGDHVQQRGSLVAPDRLRFDFAHGQALTADDLRDVEREVNQAILNELPVEIEEKPIEEARKLGAMMLFGEKYGDRVRVVSVGGEYSREFCGGTHVANASQIGPFRLVSEGSAAAGVRRVEALTGRGAASPRQREHRTAEGSGDLLGVTPAQVPDAIERLQADLKAARQTLAQTQRATAGDQAKTLAADAKTVGGVPSVIVSIANVRRRRRARRARRRRAEPISRTASSFSARPRRTTRCCLSPRPPRNSSGNAASTQEISSRQRPRRRAAAAAGVPTSPRPAGATLPNSPTLSPPPKRRSRSSWAGEGLPPERGGVPAAFRAGLLPAPARARPTAQNPAAPRIRFVF
jgi:alanyl-tRNA synthetase